MMYDVIKDFLVKEEVMSVYQSIMYLEIFVVFKFLVIQNMFKIKNYLLNERMRMWY